MLKRRHSGYHPVSIHWTAWIAKANDPVDSIDRSLLGSSKRATMRGNWLP